jgi:hypothetical protein
MEMRENLRRFKAFQSPATHHSLRRSFAGHARGRSSDTGATA